MDGLARPVGELPAEIYWRRRVVTIAFVVLGLLVAYYLIRSLFATEPEEGVSPSASVTPSPSVSVTSAAGPDLSTVRGCGPADLSMVLTPTTHDWPTGTLPSFDAQISHGGTTRCILDTSASDVALLVTSGSDRIWSSADCATAPLLTAEQRLLEPGDVSALTVTWPRIRSNEDCSAGLGDPQPGTYRAVFTIQGVESDQAVFALTSS